MAKFDQGGGWPPQPISDEFLEIQRKDLERMEKGLIGMGNFPAFKDVVRAIERRIQNGQTVTDEESRMVAKGAPSVVWVVGKNWEPTDKLMFFWEEGDARMVARALDRFVGVDGKGLGVSVWSVEVG